MGHILGHNYRRNNLGVEILELEKSTAKLLCHSKMEVANMIEIFILVK